jgi:alpha 1,2-mannosyltransferase
MNTPTRYILIVFGVVISLHYILSFTHEEYGRATSISTITSHFQGASENSKSPDSDYTTVDPYLSGAGNSSHLTSRHANATFVILARNSDADGTVRSIREIEDRFNKKFRYPYVFLNEEPFTEDFKKRVSVLSSVKMEFGLIPREHWFQPNWIDEAKAKAGRDQMEKENIIYGGSVSYRNMCRFNSGFFFKHELVQKYRYYWRIELAVPSIFLTHNNGLCITDLMSTFTAI